jgi:hypothetical protein
MGSQLLNQRLFDLLPLSGHEDAVPQVAHVIADEEVGTATRSTKDAAGLHCRVAARSWPLHHDGGR